LQATEPAKQHKGELRMGRLQQIITPLHTRTSREYLPRMQADKVHCMHRAKQYGQEYWDGDRRYGYGGYVYDGRWRPVAQALIQTYGLDTSSRILDVGCGKGFLLYELQQLLPEVDVKGFDISEYALAFAKPEIKARLFLHDAQKPFPFETNSFDLVFSINTLHNLEIFGLKTALQEMARVGNRQFLCVESYRNEQELFNLQCWALTCEAFFSIHAWQWLFNEFNFPGDYEFIHFE
jgi:SAM-dependent methyltransferase